MDKRGSRKDIGQALLKKLQSPARTSKPQLGAQKHDIGSIWQKQSHIKQIEALKRPKKSRQNSHYFKNFADDLLARLPNIKLPKVTRKRLLALTVILTVIVIANLQANNQSDGTTPETTEVMGQATSPELPVAEGVEDQLLFPRGKQASDYDIRINSPPSNADPSYVYADTLEDANNTQLFVTQQRVEGDFNLKAVADSFQATNIISVDSNLIYHGLNERTGIQSLMFIKDGSLVLIRSPYKLPDETWASYYLDLQR